MPKFERPVARPAKRSVFVYTSTCCKVPATKPALVADKEAQGTLGKFRCGQCKRRCTVTVSLNKKEEKHVQASS